MTLVEHDPAVRERLVALYLDHNLGAADRVIHYILTAPERFLSDAKHGRGLVLGLELWAAILGHRHPAILDAGEIPIENWKYWRVATKAEGTLKALVLLSEPVFAGEFDEDFRSLHPRLSAIAERHAGYDRRSAEQSDD